MTKTQTSTVYHTFISRIFVFFVRLVIFSLVLKKLRIFDRFLYSSLCSKGHSTFVVVLRRRKVFPLISWEEIFCEITVLFCCFQRYLSKHRIPFCIALCWKKELHPCWEQVTYKKQFSRLLACGTLLTVSALLRSGFSFY